MSLIKASVKNLDRLKAALKNIPRGAKKPALEAASKYLVGDEGRGLKHYPAYHSPTYIRTFRLQNNWEYVVNGSNAYVSNNTPYAKYPQGQPPTQIMQRIGWRGYRDVINSNMKGAIRSAKAAVTAWIKANL